MIAFLSEKLHRKASYVSDGVCTTPFTSSAAQTKKNLSLLADTIEEFGGGQERDVIGNFEFTPSTSSFSVDNSIQLSVNQVSWLTRRELLLTSLEYVRD